MSKSPHKQPGARQEMASASLKMKNWNDDEDEEGEEEDLGEKNGTSEKPRYQAKASPEK